MIVNKKAIIINGIILGLLVGFVIMSITVYYLVPASESIIDYLRGVIEQLIEQFRR